MACALEGNGRSSVSLAASLVCENQKASHDDSAPVAGESGDRTFLSRVLVFDSLQSLLSRHAINHSKVSAYMTTIS